MSKVTTRFRQPKYKLTFIRQWREDRGYSLEQLGEMVGITHASLSRIERGLQPYGQKLLEAIAEALRTDVPSLLMRNPTDPEGIWSVWDQAKPGEKSVIVDLARTILRRGTA